MKAPTPTNFIARALRTNAKFRKQVVRDRSKYSRKIKHKSKKLDH